MADVLIRDIPALAQPGGFRPIIWATVTVGYFIHIHESNGDLVYKKTTDGGATWGSDVTINPANAVAKFSCWADWWTSGDTGNLIHIVNLDESIIAYNNLDVTDDTLSSEVNVVEISDATSQHLYSLAILDIVKSRGGNLYVTYFNQGAVTTTSGFERSTDGGATWDAMATPYESDIPDKMILQPGDFADSNDIFAIFWDNSADELDRKDFDNSTDSWTTVNIATGIPDTVDTVHEFAAIHRQSDNKSMVIIHRGLNVSTSDLLCFEIGSTSIVAKTDVWTDRDDHLGVALTIDQNNDNLYAGFLGGVDTGENFLSNLNPYRALSTDGGGTWSTGVKINESTGENFQEVYLDPSVGGTRAGLVALAWVHRLVTTFEDVFYNAVNAIEILNSSGNTGDTEGPSLGVGAGKIGAGIRVDWDNNGTFDADEELGGDVTSLRWTRGKDPEELNTPGGTLIIEVEDPNGDYVPGESATAFDSKFTSSDVSVGKDVTANLEYDGTSHAIFRGSIASITPFRFNGEQRATLFCVDEMDRFSEIELSVPLSSTSGTSGGATSSGMRPMGSQDGESVVLGGTTGLLAHILNDASFSSARALSEVGRSTMDNYWIYNVNVRDAFFDIEKHERGSIFMSSSGDVTFLSSTHYTGLASSATFGPSTSLFTRLDYSMNSKDIVNRVLATVHDRSLGTSTTLGLTVVGSLDPGIISLSQGSAIDIEVIFDKAPCRSITIPAVEKDSTSGISAVGAGGTSHVSNTTSGNHVSVFGQVRGASSIVLTITNNAGETVTFNQPETAEDSGTAFPISGILMPNRSVESTAISIASRDIYGRRNFNVDYQFFEGVVKGNTIAQNIVNNGSTADPTGIRLHITGSDSDLVLQILSREVGDVIAVNSTHFHLATNQEYYITSLEGEIAAGGPLQTVWTLQKST